MTRSASPPLCVTMGDPKGVGPEIAATAWRALNGAGPSFFIAGLPQAYEGLVAPTRIIGHPREAASVFKEALPILSVGELDAPVAATVASIEYGVSCALAGDAAGVVTCPINKAVFAGEGFQFPGHTEFLAALTEGAAMSGARGPVMMLAGPSLRAVPVTVHEPLARAVAGLTAERIVRAGRVTAEALQNDFGIERPRLAIAGLNPHAGEGGVLGREDGEIIAPAVDALQAEGIEARGPMPADTMFHEEARAEYDAALCMYHDQALIPAKALGFHEAVNVTLGLPIVRTSPDHGTAYDIAGKGIARADSMIAAINLAGAMAERRNAAS